MGMFDTVYIPCSCGREIEVQSKAGPCLLNTYGINAVPEEIVDDLDGTIAYCRCGKQYQIGLNQKKRFVPLPVQEIKD